MNVLVVVDMQNDFVCGSLGSTAAQKIVPNVIEKIKRRKAEGWKVVFTLDTHVENYLDTREGRLLPVVHCVKNTVGWRLEKNVQELANDCETFEKPTFGSIALAREMQACNPQTIEIVGLCTDICVVSNALVLKAALPETEICVDSSCCAGTSEKSHAAALDTMRSCQITVY